MMMIIIIQKTHHPSLLDTIVREKETFSKFESPNKMCEVVDNFVLFRGFGCKYVAHCIFHKLPPIFLIALGMMMMYYFPKSC